MTFSSICSNNLVLGTNYEEEKANPRKLQAQFVYKLYTNLVSAYIEPISFGIPWIFLFSYSYHHYLCGRVEYPPIDSRAQKFRRSGKQHGKEIAMSPDSTLEMRDKNPS
jgi:hypothetical protein